MKTQISRWSDEPRKRRSGLYQQQGRMISDADWNELMELLKRRIDEALGEVVGSGAPRLGNPGLGNPGLIESGAAGSTAPLIKRNTFYVDGIRASLESAAAGTGSFALNQQADFPATPAYPAAEQMLYADVWEWPTTALEDGSLLDPGLHGADTATRTQTLAQVKWCPVAINPLTDVRNPSKGDALCRLEIRAGSSAADPCDACAAEIALDTRIGNYLFRLEVHDVVGPADAPTEITLKWSSENAAEHFAQAEAPAEFKRSDWIYEFYNTTTERHLGVHLAAGFIPARALLREGWPSGPGLPDQNTFPFVRRWDGQATLIKSGAGWSIKTLSGVVQARDKGRRFEAPAATAVPTHGHFIYAAPDFILYLSGLQLTLTLDGKKFVAGDYWLGTVREDAEAAARVQLSSSTPLGVTHHYMVLGRATAGAVQALGDADARRLSFPKLTDLTADRVGYSPSALTARWTDVIDDAATAAPLNVQRAIDLLVERLDSSDLSYLVPGCGTAAVPTVRSLLNVAAGSQKLDTVIGRLLCDFNARHLPIDKTDPALAPIFNVPAVASVQQGLSVLGNALANLTAEATVGPGGQYATLSDAFTALAPTAISDVSLCLLPGVQSLPTALTLSGKRTIRLTGVGPYASRISLGAQLQLGAQEIVVRDLAVVGQSNGNGNLVLQADRVVAQSCGFARAASYSSHVWSKRFGGTFADQGQSVAVDASGNIIVTGFFAGTANFGGSDLVSTSNTQDIFIAKFTPQGVHVWSKRFGAAAGPVGRDGGNGVAVDAAGNVLFTGFFAGSVTFGGANLVGGANGSVFLVKLDPAGNHLWSKSFGNGATGASVAVDASGNVVITGSFQFSIDLGGGVINSGTASDLFIAKFNSAGTHVWSKGFGGSNTTVSFNSGNSVAVDGTGNVFVTGSFQGTVNFGGAPLVAAGTSSMFLLKLLPAGAHAWSKHFDVVNFTSGASAGLGVAVDPAGNVVLTGYFDSNLDFGGGLLSSNATTATFLAKFDTAGAHLWSKRFIGIATSTAQGSGLAIDTGGNLTLIGLFAGTVQFGGTELRSTSGLGGDVFVARFDAQGSHQWSKRFGAGVEDQGCSVAVDAGGQAIVTGSFTGSINFGGGTLSSATGSDRDIFLAKLLPEPFLKPLVEVRGRDATRGADLVWSQNDMLVSIADADGIRLPRTALALATPNIGGDILDNTINGRLLLQSGLPLSLEDPFVVPGGTTSVGGGAYLTIRGNALARIASRYEGSPSNLDAAATLIVADNTLAETGNSLIAESLTFSNNHILTQASNDSVGIAVARQIMVLGNQATHQEATFKVTVSSIREVGNAMTTTRVGLPVLQPNPPGAWYFGGVGADLV